MIIKTWNYLNSFEFGTPVQTDKERFLLGPPFHILLVNLVYLSFIYKIGPAYMKNRQPFRLKEVLLVYNFLQIMLNLFVPICAFIMIFCFRFYEIGCLMSLPLDHPYKYIEIWCFYTYYVIKFIDYIDTVFFVLRKSMRQVTFLHVYHHMMMANAGYIYLRYHGFGGHIGTMGILNSIVHVFMYFYYFTSALKPSMKNSIWWKKYITRLQLSQFVIVLIHNVYPLMFRPDCKSPKFMFYFAIVQSILMIYLFGKFYINNYIRGEKKQKVSSSKIQNGKIDNKSIKQD